MVTPLAFLSGTFYSAERLPPFWERVAHLNPFFYMIDGFRYGFIDHADGSLAIGLVIMLVSNLALIWLALWCFRSGYRLKT